MTVPQLVDAMEDAATVDLRGSEVLPWALRVLGRPRDPSLRAAVATLRDWVRSGAHRIDRNRDGRYDHAEAVRIMDAWWPRWMRAEFEPALGRPLFERIQAINELANLPNNHGDHLGSAWQDGWYSYALKDLRMLVAKRGRGRSARRIKVRGRFSRIYCGGGRRPFGSLRRCRSRLAASLKDALAVPERSLYSGDAVCKAAGRDGDQACFDADLLPPARRHHAAADAVGQPADVPAGGGGRRALAEAARRLTLLVRRTCGRGCGMQALGPRPAAVSCAAYRPRPVVRLPRRPATGRRGRRRFQRTARLVRRGRPEVAILRRFGWWDRLRQAAVRDAGARRRTPGWAVEAERRPGTHSPTAEHALLLRRQTADVHRGQSRGCPSLRAGRASAWVIAPGVGAPAAPRCSWPRCDIPAASDRAPPAGTQSRSSAWRPGAEPPGPPSWRPCDVGVHAGHHLDLGCRAW